MDERTTRGPEVVHRLVVDTTPRRVLLFNPPVYDIRFPWGRWHQPVALLQLATLLRRAGCDVRLIDALSTPEDKNLRRRLVREVMRGEVSIKYWRYGELPSTLTQMFHALEKENWHPDEVYVEGFVTYWWEGVHEAIELTRSQFPNARIVLLGAYPRLAINHAAKSRADVIVAGAIEGTCGLPMDLSLCAISPSFSYVSIGSDARAPEDVVNEVKTKAASSGRRVFRFLFADHDVLKRFPQHVRRLLESVADHKLRVAFQLQGNVYPHDFVGDNELASLLKRAGVKQIAFADDRDMQATQANRDQLIEDTHRAVETLKRAGYAPGTDDLAAMVSVGQPEERIGDLARYMAELAHVAGSIIPVPYQPTPYQMAADMPLEMQNGKLFPFAEHNGLSYRSYQDVIGLAALLNAKYRDATFDFLGDGLIPQLVRHSLASQSWDPRLTDSLVPKKPIIIGYFNKEGKWVRP